MKGKAWNQSWVLSHCRFGKLPAEVSHTDGTQTDLQLVPAQWSEANSIIPPSQNGFRHTYRTNNNAFVLCCLIEKARAMGKTLFVGFVDICNTFPSTDHASHQQTYKKLFGTCTGLYKLVQACTSPKSAESKKFKSQVKILASKIWNLCRSEEMLITSRLH